MRLSSPRKGEDFFQVLGAADPTNGQHLIVCGYNQDPRQNLWSGYVYSSADAGTSWRETVLDKTTKFVSEESCTYDAEGRSYFADGESDTSTGVARHEWGHFTLFTSDDHGMSWNKTWNRKDGWIDWTSLAAAPASNGSPGLLVAFGNSGTDKLGHWWPARPVAIVSRDGGRSFTNLLVPHPPLGFRYLTVWASGSAMLSDGTALFAASASIARPKEKPAEWWHGHLRVEIFAYSPATGTVRSRAVVRAVPSKSILPIVSMAQDTSRGRFGGRLYTTWLETDQNEDGMGTLWLGTSDDHGYHWSTRPISFMSCVGRSNVRLAVAPNGTLGILWSEESRRLYLALSRDGGRTFAQSILIAYHEPGALAASGAVPYNDYWAGEILAQQTGKSETGYFDQKHLGVSILIGQPTGIPDYAVVANAKDTFHVLWSQVESNGTHGLFTRTVHVGSEMSSVSSKLTGTSPQMCSDDGEVHPPLPGTMPTLRPTGQREISSSFSLSVQNLHYNNATRIVSADVILTNKGKTVVRSPLSFFGIGLHSDYGTVAAANATGVIQGQPFWDASAVVPASGLQPGASSKPLMLRFKITRFQQLLDGGSGGDASAMLVRIYQRQ